ncbi:unnamed protein product [Ectocarpus sp. CCAP 1310/34]|nr:unnamed protein product [Ectocarpus sp. CCAP 1310/34]
MTELCYMPLPRAATHKSCRRCAVRVLGGRSTQLVLRQGALHSMLRYQVGTRQPRGVLMVAGADVNILDANGTAPLHLAIWRGHVGVAKDLLLSGANPNNKHPGSSLPFHDAIGRGLDE